MGRVDEEPEGLSGWLFGGGTVAGLAGVCLAVILISAGRVTVVNLLILTSGLGMLLKGLMTMRLPPRRRRHDEP